jgi:hypothetical protein
MDSSSVERWDPRRRLFRVNGDEVGELDRTVSKESTPPKNGKEEAKTDQKRAD